MPEPMPQPVPRPTPPTADLNPLELQLYQHLAQWRRGQARERGLAPFQILTNRTLADLARRRPGNPATLQWIFGIGPAKARDWGEAVLAVLREGAGAVELPLCCDPAELAEPIALPMVRRRTDAESVAEAHRIAEVAFAAGLPVALTAELCARAPGTVETWLQEWAERHPEADLSPWLSPETRRQVRTQAEIAGSTRLKPLRDALGPDTVSYLEVRLALVGLPAATHLAELG